MSCATPVRRRDRRQQGRRAQRLPAAICVSAVLDATDQQYVVVVEDSESDTIVTAPRDVPSS
jgi:hypothetical protein